MEGPKQKKKLKKKIDLCEDDLQKLLAEITGLEGTKDKMKKKLGGILSLPGKLLSKVSDLKLFQDKLKLPQNGIPVANKTLTKLDQLSGIATAIGCIVEILTGKKTKLQTTIEAYDAKLDGIKQTYENKVANIDQLKDELTALIIEKSGIKDQINGTVSDVKTIEHTVQDFINRYHVFDKKTDCEDKKELEDKIEEVKSGQAQTEPVIEELEEELQDAEQQTEQLETETQQIEELIKEGQSIKEEYGTDVDLEPVQPKEWAESFEVERPYWAAVFHPDDEVVEGQKGRYFEVKLKDAEKNVKLLFGPGEYCMSKSDFRKKYG